jgi:secondary thiamine-phosphate synthase enzyme
MKTLNIKSALKRQVIDITNEIEDQLKGSGVVNIFVKHTTAAITTADLDPGTDVDYLSTIKALTPDIKWRHPHDPVHFPDHFWSTIIGPDLTMPFSDGKLELGTWQRVILIEFDGPRTRLVIVSLL